MQKERKTNERKIGKKKMEIKRGTNNRSQKYVTFSEAAWKGSVFMTKIKSRQIHYILYIQFKNFDVTEDFNKRQTLTYMVLYFDVLHKRHFN